MSVTEGAATHDRSWRPGESPIGAVTKPLATDETPCEVPDADPTLPDVPDPDTETDDCGHPAGKFRRIAGVVLPLVIGVAAVVVVAGIAGDADSMTRALRSATPRDIGLALACEVASFACLGWHLRLIAGPGENVRRLAPFRIALVVFGLGSVMPAAPAEGLVMAGAALKHRRLARRRTVLVLGVSQLFGSTGLYALAAIDALVVVSRGHDGPLGSRWLLLAASTATLAVIAVSMRILTRARFAERVGLLAGRLRHPRHPASPDERRARGVAWHAAAMHVVKDRRRASLLAVTVLLGWALDGACLFFALAAIGVHVHIDVLLLAYSISAGAALIPFLPAGLGVVETLTPAVLHLYGVPIEAAVAGLVIYRVLGTLLPAAMGAGALATLRLLSAPAIAEPAPDGDPGIPCRMVAGSGKRRLPITCASGARSNTTPVTVDNSRTVATPAVRQSPEPQDIRSDADPTFEQKQQAVS